MKKFKYSAMRYPSIKQHSNKHLAFIDPSKAEEDKLCEEYLREMIDLNRELSSRPKPYNKSDIQRSDLITTSMKDEVALKQVIQDLAAHQDNPVNARLLREEQEQAEKRARRHYMLFQDNLLNAFMKERFYIKRPYLSHANCIKLLIILQFNVLQKLRYASERMHVNGILELTVYTFFYVLIGVPIQFAMRALSQFSKATVISTWNFCPFLKGTGAMMLIYAVYYMLRSIAHVSMTVYMFVDVLRGNIGWLICNDPKDCFTGPTNETRHVDCLSFALKDDIEPKVYSSGITYYVKLVESSFSGYDSSLKWDGLMALLTVWFSILLFMIAGFEKFIQVTATLFVVVLFTGVTVIAVMLACGSASANGLTEFFQISPMYKEYIFAHMPFGDIFFDCMVSSGIINFLAAHAPHYVDPMVDTYVFAITDLTITYCLTLATFTAVGYLQTHYHTKHPSCFLISRDITMMAVIPEYLARLDFGKLWIFMYLIFVILSQIAFIVTAAHMTVNSLTDLFASNIESGGHSSLIFLLIGCGFTYNIFFDFAHGQTMKDEMRFTFKVVELIVILNFIVAVVFMYSSTTLCNNVYLITNERPSAYCEFSLKFCLLLVFIFGTNHVLIIIDHYKEFNWIMCLAVCVPLFVSAMNRISNVFHKPSLSLFGIHEDWCVNNLVKDADPTRPRYERVLICTHRCLRQYMFSHFEEARLQSLRKCFAIAYAPYLYENIEQ